jgi:hypothetical protein
VYSPAGAVQLPSHLASCTPTDSNLYLDSSLKTVIRESALYELLMFHVPNLMSILRCLGCLSKECVQVQGSLMFCNKLVVYSEGLAPCPTPPPAGGPPLVVCPRLLIQYILTYPPLLEAIPPSATRGPAMLWWQGDPPHMVRLIKQSLN